MRSLPLLAGLSLLLASPALAAKPTLKERVEALEARLAAMEHPRPTEVAPSGDDEAAMVLYKDANHAFQEGHVDTAKELLQELMTKFPDSRVTAAASRLQDQIAVVGTPVADLPGVDWLQGSYQLGSDRAALLVFWEVWCPHCQREVPRLQATYTKFHDRGLGVVGLTKLTRGKTAADALAFAQAQGLTYPIGHEDGTLSGLFGVSGVPAAAVVVDGKVVWRGHPAQLDDAMIEGWLKK